MLGFEMNNCISGVLLIGTFSASTVLGHIYRIYSTHKKLAVTVPVPGSTLLGHQTSIRKWPRQAVNSQRTIHRPLNTTQGGGCFWRCRLHIEFGHCWICRPLRGGVGFRGMMSAPFPALLSNSLYCSRPRIVPGSEFMSVDYKQGTPPQSIISSLAFCSCEPAWVQFSMA